MLSADLLAVGGWFIVKLNGGTELHFPLFGLSALLLWNVLFFWSRAQLKARPEAQPSSPSA